MGARGRPGEADGGFDEASWTVSVSALVAAADIARLHDTAGPQGWQLQEVRGNLAREHPGGLLCSFTVRRSAGLRACLPLMRAVRSMRAHRARDCLIAGSWRVRATSSRGTLVLETDEIRWLAAMGAWLDVDLLDNRGAGAPQVLVARQRDRLCASATGPVVEGSVLRSLLERVRTAGSAAAEPCDLTLVCTGTASGQDGVRLQNDFFVAARTARRLWVTGGGHAWSGEQDEQP